MEVSRVSIIFAVALFCWGCVTNDFKVVEALRRGMTQAEAEQTVASFGFRKEQASTRPEGGWPPSDNTFANLPGRARAMEKKLQKGIERAELYPVGHGLLGAGLLFLFYGADGRLMEFYRYQIN